ncbi:hypothetical protein EYZ11_008988 [Aspergillus tanneri]|uniref:Fumarylacetoacetase n=1 Tax=Aspergillus tanneri TaxID=1220188 RepID=A0A4S3JB76_9EURO|nr:hypothetical protein EYZ11_008988 [Aspergillus tanneri]
MATANYTDFYCSLEHAQNCSEVAGGQVSPNWYCIPTCYNGRTSSLRISGQPIRRPWGVVQESGPSSQPTWSPSQRLDFELEMGVFLSKAIPAGQVLDIRHAKEHIFGFVLLNDWSARDIQKFEMPPLGPFHSKGFGTTISPWIVTMEALEPVACPRVTQQNPSPLPHLTWKDSAESEIFKIELSAKILMYHVTSTNLNELYWTPYQQLTYLASAGEGLSTGDILGTGTLSSNRQSPEGEKAGLACLLERMMPKNKMSVLKNEGIEFLEDGDEVVFEGWCYHPKTSRWFGFGECRARVLQALSLEAL